MGATRQREAPLAAIWYPEVVDPKLAVGTRARQISTIRGLQQTRSPAPPVADHLR